MHTLKARLPVQKQEETRSGSQCISSLVPRPIVAREKRPSIDCSRMCEYTTIRGLLDFHVYSRCTLHVHSSEIRYNYSYQVFSIRPMIYLFSFLHTGTVVVVNVHRS